MSKADDSYIDSKNIEGKAIRCFEDYLEDSTIISPYLASDEKEPCWDGHLYLYSGKTKDKDHLSGRIPVQVKGKVVNEFKLNKYKFQIDTNDLQAYLYEPTVYVVCQEKKSSKEKKLLYRCLLPETIKNILRGKDKQKSISVLMHQIPKQLDDFANKMMVFLGDSRKQLSFADNKSFTMRDVEKREIKEFSFLAPAKKMNEIELMKYLSLSPTYLYAKVDKELNIEIPISDGPMIIAFKQNVKKEISIGETIFFNNYENEIKDGKMYISISNILTIIVPINNDSDDKPEIKIDTQFLLLKDSIIKAEFLIASYDAREIKIGDFVLKLEIKGKKFIDNLRFNIIKWKAFQDVLVKLHVTKDIEINGITKEQEVSVNVLLKTIGEGNSIKLDNREIALNIIEISNIRLLLWLVGDKGGNFMFLDFFNQSIKIIYQVNKDERVETCLYSYLSKNNLWDKIDNIPFDKMISFYIDVSGKNKYVYNMATLDLLSILHTFDKIKEKDKNKSVQLIKSAKELNDWLIEKDPLETNKITHTINHYQIIKRQRDFSNKERSKLSIYLNDDSISPRNKVALCLLLDKKEDLKDWLRKCTRKEIKEIKSYPIWNFR